MGSSIIEKSSTTLGCTGFPEQDASLDGRGEFIGIRIGAESEN